nr:serine/threonine-protein kinase [Kofleriaceae bacterium]
MSSTPATTLSCPRCRASLAEPSRYCPSCGVEMERASLAGPPSESTTAAGAAPTTGGSSSGIPTADADASDSRATDRRLTDSNKAWLGKIVDGRYRVLDVIGRGGMGVVYRVEHMRMGKVAAMKVLHRDLVGDAEVQQRFEREAAAVSKLHHPHTVQVFDFGAAQGALYLIMEYVRGQDLARILERDGAMPWARAAPLLVQICGALQEAHEMGVIHRDLKPENVLITRTTAGRDYAKVLDFGLAKLEQRERENLAATDRQQIVGTPYFMAPEQIRGDDVDARTDIYSFGALMFELLTGTHLYTGSTAVGVLTKHLTAEPDAPSMRAPKQGLPPQVDHLCRKALARDPSQRWKTAAELAAAIEEVYVETVGDITGPGASRSSRRTRRPLTIAQDDIAASELALRRADLEDFERGMRRWRYMLWGGTVALLAAAAGGVTWYVTRAPAPLTEEREPNDDVMHANHIALDHAVTGYLGRRISPVQGDRDVFVVPAAPDGGKRIVTVTLTAPPNIDVALTLADGDGLHGASADDGGVGETELLHRRSVDGAIVVTVAETMHDKLPVENVSDSYTLTVALELPGDGEIEPNDIDSDATPLADGKELHGFLDARGDVDMLRWQGGDGEVSVVVRADGLPLEWRAPDGSRRTPGQATVALHHGDLIVLDRTDAHGAGPVVARDKPWSIVVTGIKK